MLDLSEASVAGIGVALSENTCRHGDTFFSRMVFFDFLEFFKFFLLFLDFEIVLEDFAGMRLTVEEAAEAP